ncbi:MAG: hypothetical protein ACPL4C_04350 [Brevinematia bacterium]
MNIFASKPFETIIPLFNITSSLINLTIIIIMILQLRTKNLKISYQLTSNLILSLVNLPISIVLFLSNFYEIQLLNIFFSSWILITLVTSTYNLSSEEKEISKFDLWIIFFIILTGISCLTHTTESVLISSAIISALSSIYLSIKYTSRNIQKILISILTILQSTLFLLEYTLKLNYIPTSVTITITNSAVLYLTFYYIISKLSEESKLAQEIKKYFYETKNFVNNISDVLSENKQIVKQQNKFIFFLQQDNQKFYSYFKYFSGLLNEASESISEMKFLLRNAADNISKISSKISESIQLESKIQENFSKFEGNISKTLPHYEDLGNNYQNLSYNLTQITLITKEINKYTKEQQINTENLIEKLNELLETTNTIISISVEGQIISKNKNVDTLGESFREIKNKIEETESKIINLKTLSIEKISNLSSLNEKNENFTEDIYKLLSTVDKVKNNTSSIVEYLMKVNEIINQMKVSLEKTEEKIKIKSDLEKLLDYLSKLFEKISTTLNTLDETLKSLITIKDNLSKITTSLEEITKLTNFYNVKFENLSKSIDELLRQISIEV